MGCGLFKEVDNISILLSKYSIASIDQLKDSNNPQLTTGLVIPSSKVLIAPISLKECVMYTIQCEEMVSYNDGGIFQMMFLDKFTTNFYIIDALTSKKYISVSSETSPIVYLTTKCSSIIIRDSNDFNNLSIDIKEILSKHNVKIFKAKCIFYQIIISETIVTVNSQISILSILKPITSNDTIYYEAQPITKDQYFSLEYPEHINSKNSDLKLVNRLIKDKSIYISDNTNIFKDHIVDNKNCKLEYPIIPGQTIKLNEIRLI